MIALVNGDEQRTAVWHVDINSDLRNMSRLGGAWVTDNDNLNPLVLTGRHVFLFADAIPSAAEPWVQSVIDVSATLTNISEWVAEQDRIHANTPTDKGNERAPISWPKLPEPLDWNALPPPPRGVVEDKLMADAIVAAHWVAGLADAWQAVEVIRMSRKHLKGDDVETRVLPLALIQRVSA